APSTAPPSAPTPSSHAATAATPAPPASAVEAGLPIVAPAAKGGGTSNPPGPVVAIAILAGLLAISALIWAYARWRGVESAWLLGLGHALSEAGYRLESTWSEFTDWLRTGH
ncbi:MAG TPA: hypothetical protein VHX88_10765, partial [Solirubrobacteraceae bacterium]|nr:hypothetical protein [Solirubrobacteraceae bacterium]